MKSSEIYKELSLPYDELTKYLIEKYGPSKVDYFCNSTCKSRNNAVSRTAEGLLCHHIDEDKGGNLSNSVSAVMQPYEWQKKERLVYCNYIEHLILHIKIAILRQKAPLREPIDILNFFTTGGIYMVCQNLNDLFSQGSAGISWQQRCYAEIEENVSDYILIIKLLLKYIRQQYIGDKNASPFLREGALVKFENCTGIIAKLDESNKKILVELPDGNEHLYSWNLFSSQFTYDDVMHCVMQQLASGYKTLHNWIYENFTQELDSNITTELLPLLQIDFHGFGFPQFAYDFIDKEKYGSASVDEYISHAFPSFSKLSYEISDTRPTFWIGRIPPRVNAKSFFYIVRVQAVFSVKEGVTPFIQYKKSTPFRMSDTSFGGHLYNMLTFRHGRTVSSSFVFDKKNNRYYAAYYDLTGKLTDSELIVSMTKEDYARFKKCYYVRKCKVLDGCYFEK